MQRKVIISCALTGAADTPGRNPAVPVTPEQIAQSAIEAAKAGAAIVHIHVRNPKTTKPSMDTALYREVVERIRESGTGVLINLTTGPGARFTHDDSDPSKPGPDSVLKSPEDRVRHVLELKPDICSLDMGSLNMGDRVFVNTPKHLQAMAEAIKQAGVMPELEVFETGHLLLAKRFLEHGYVKPPGMFQICLGIAWGQPATSEAMTYMRNLLPPDSPWFAFGISLHQFPMVAQTILLGGHPRVGLEDNLYLGKGKLAPSNAALVEKAAKIIEILGDHVATPTEARQILGFGRKSPVTAIDADAQASRGQPGTTMTIRVAAVEVSHWHALNDAAYLRHLIAMPDVQLVAIQDSDATLVAKRAAEVGNPPTYTDYHAMLKATRPDFVVALGRHSQMAAIAHDLLDAGYPFLMEKPMGISAAELEPVAEKAAKRKAYVAVPLAQRYGAFAKHARELLAEKRFGPLSHIYARINRPAPPRYPAWDCAWMLDPAESGGGCLRNLGSHGLDMFLHLTGEEAQVTGAQLSRRAHNCQVEDYASVMLRSTSGILGTIEIGNVFPRDGTDGEWKIAGRDAILTMKDDIVKLATATGDEVFPGSNTTAPYFTTVRDALDHWREGKAPPIGVHDCLRAVRLIDQAYARAKM